MRTYLKTAAAVAILAGLGACASQPEVVEEDP